MRLPVAAKIAFASAGMVGGSAGSPRPVGGLSVDDEVDVHVGRLLDPRRRRTGGSCSARPCHPEWRSPIPSGGSCPRRRRPDSDWSALLGFTICRPTSPATQTLFTLTRFCESTATSATLAKYPRWLYWNPTPIAVPFGSCRLPHPDLSRTASSTPRMRAASNPLPPCCGSGIAGPFSISRRNAIGSLPAAIAISSMNDWKTNEKALLRGARCAPVGHAQRHERRLEVVVRDEARRELDAGDVRRVGEALLAFRVVAVADEVIAPRDETAGASTPAFRKWKPPGR